MKAIIFDMYGVIVKQTGDDFVPYVRQFFPNLSIEDILTPWFQADIGELTSLDVWEKLGYKGDLEQVEKKYLDTIELNEGFIEFISAAQKQYKCAIISNDSSRWGRYLREKFDINKYFDAISISGELRIQKPDRRIFDLTVEKLGCTAAECLYVDDREEYLAAAESLGMKTVMFNSRQSSYNGKSVMSFKELGDMLF